MNEKQIEIRITGAQGSGKTTAAAIIATGLREFNDAAVYVFDTDRAMVGEAELSACTEADYVIIVGGAGNE